MKSSPHVNINHHSLPNKPNKQTRSCLRKVRIRSDTVKVEDVDERRIVEVDYDWAIFSLDHSYSFHSIGLAEPSTYHTEKNNSVV
jgi:hypothetical protein